MRSSPIILTFLSIKIPLEASPTRQGRLSHNHLPIRAPPRHTISPPLALKTALLTRNRRNNLKRKTISVKSAFSNNTKEKWKSINIFDISLLSDGFFSEEIRKK